MTEALGLPPPDGDSDGPWLVHLADGVPDGARVAPTGRDPRAQSDRVSSFAIVDRALPPGCSLDLAMARAVARGSLWRAAPAMDEGSARAQSEMLARLATTCAAPEDDLRAFQDEPERTIVDPSSPELDRGASMFFDWLDTTFGASPGGLVTGLWALSATRTPFDAARWAATPGWFDVLRVSLAGALGADSSTDDVFLQFAVSRALAVPGARLAWHIPWPAQARRLASPVPVAPTGASYVMIDHGAAPPGASLRLTATWEDYGRMRWAAIKLDGGGRTKAVVPITTQRLATTASITVELLDDVDRILVVGVDVGSTEHDFDPDQGWWEPHGWLLTVEAE
jgi:hypothetical protein